MEKMSETISAGLSFNSELCSDNSMGWELNLERERERERERGGYIS